MRNPRIVSFLLAMSLVIFMFVITGRVLADTQDYFPGTENAVKGTISGAAFPGAIQNSDGSYRTPQESNQAPGTSDLTPDTETVTTGTKVSGTFNADVISDNGASITYREANTAPSQTLAFDEKIESIRTATTDPYTWNHIPIGTPNGIIVTAIHGIESTDCIVTGASTTYGGVQMSRVTTAADTLNEPGRVYAYFLGSGIPTGTQTVSMDIAATGACSTTDMEFISISYTAGADTVILTSAVDQENQANPTATLSYSSREALAVMAFYSGSASSGLPFTSACSGNSACTLVDNYALAVAYSATVDRQTTRGALDQVMGYTIGTDDVALVYVAITQTDSSPNYQISIKYDWTTETCADTRRLTVNAWHTNSENILVQVYPASEGAPTTQLTITATADGTTLTYDLTSDEWDSGDPNIRFLGNLESGDTTQTDLLADYVTIQCIHPADYESEVKYSWTGVDTSGDSWKLVIECARVTNPENFLIQVYPSDEGTPITRYTCDQNSDTTYDTYFLTTDELDGGSPDIRFVDTDQASEGSQSTWNLDVIKITRTYTVSNNVPTITVYGITPGTGTYATSFAFYAIYTDADNEAPTFMKMEIVSVSNRTMTENNTGDTTYTDGKAYYLTDSGNTYCPASYSFFFSTSDGIASIRTTPSSSFSVSNTVPSINNGGSAPTTVIHGNDYSYDFNAADIDVPTCQSFTWSKVTGPSWLGMDSGTGVLSGTAPDDTSQGGDVTVRVSDGTATNDYGPYIVTITNSNPTWTANSPPATVHHGDAYSYDFDATDSDPLDYIYYLKDAGPAWLSINQGTGLYSGNAPHTLASGGSNTVTVHDQAISNGTAEHIWSITITNENPAFTSGQQSSETAQNETAYSHDYNALDASSDPIYFTMATNNTEMDIGFTNGTVWGFVTILGVYYVNVTVHDNANPNGTAWNNYTLTVNYTPPSGEAGTVSWIFFMMLVIISFFLGLLAFRPGDG